MTIRSLDLNQINTALLELEMKIKMLEAQIAEIKKMLKEIQK